MWYFFQQAEDFPISVSPVSVETYLREQKISGLLEKHIDEKTGAVLVFANGSPAGAYEFEANTCKSISIAEFSNLSSKSEQDQRVIKLPQQALRLTWLSLESQVKDVFNIQTHEAWISQTKNWESDKWNGLVEVQSEAYHGFALFWEGLAKNQDVFFSSVQGFSSDLLCGRENHNSQQKVITFNLTPGSQAYQCTVLRLGATHWGNKILFRYQELVGQKLLQSMDRELNRLTKPWEWEIKLENDSLIDTHFFHHTSLVAHAYRAIFMGMGAQMSFVIGSNLTQKIMTETFDSIPASESTLLQAQRLIPAAFTE